VIFIYLKKKFQYDILKINRSILKIIIWIWNLKSSNSENWYFNSKNGYLNISTWYLIMDTNISILKMLFEYEVWDLNFENYYLQSKSDISIKIYILFQIKNSYLK
jgi:hypothetical protein